MRATTWWAWVDFVKGQRKDDVMHEQLAGFTGTEGSQGELRATVDEL